jgi:hypothetical protein
LNNIESDWENQAMRITDLVYYKYWNTRKR